jgi:hypothetical protein
MTLENTNQKVDLTKERIEKNLAELKRRSEEQREKFRQKAEWYEQREKIVSQELRALSTKALVRFSWNLEGGYWFYGVVVEKLSDRLLVQDLTCLDFDEWLRAGENDPRGLVTNMVFDGMPKPESIKRFA